MPYCHSCGSEIDEEDKYCAECGAELEKKNNSDESSESSESRVMHKADSEGVSLLAGEEVKLNEHPSLFKWTGSITGALIFGIGGLIIGSMAFVLFGGLVSLLFILKAYGGMKNSRYVVTNKRVVKKEGLMADSSAEIRLSDINTLKKTNLGNDVSISTTSAGGDLVLDFVTDADKFADTIRQLQDN